MYPLKDNSILKISNLSHEQYNDLRWIADCPLKDLVDKDLNNVWLFPKPEERHDDKIDDDQIFSIRRDKDGFELTTYNIMGYVGYGDIEVTIESRFSNNRHDWFMQYMLQKVFAINIFDLKHSSSKTGTLNIAPLLFPYFLQKAMRQGVYKEYRRCNYNNSRIKGTIDFNRHIKENYPFKNGKICYSSREYIYDNSITQLIRHTIEFIKRSESFSEILVSSNEIKSFVKQIIEATPSYCKGDIGKILKDNLKPKIHPYFSEYLPLQKLCLQILKREQVGYGNDTDKIHGVLFDGAWLWEEYLNLTLQKAGFTHPENKTEKGAIYPFKNKKRYSRYPDFIRSNVIADAKYKYMLKPSDSNGRIYENIGRDDLHQMISYLHITGSKTGIYVTPTTICVMNPLTGTFADDTDLIIQQEKLLAYKVGELQGDGGDIYIMGVHIPQEIESYQEFASAMEITEAKLLEAMKELLSMNAL